MDSFNDGKQKLSEFNEAVFQIQRLHNLWVECHVCTKRGDINHYKWVLDRTWLELYVDAKRLDDDKRRTFKYIETLNKINEKVAKAKTKDELYAILKEKEMFLRELQDTSGKGSKRTDAYENIM